MTTPPARTRRKHDFLGEKDIPFDADWGAHSARAVENFPISGQTVRTENLVEATQDTGSFVQLSGVLKRVAFKLSKVCNDLRLLTSGPQAGFGDIKLSARQGGSSTMPGSLTHPTNA